MIQGYEAGTEIKWNEENTLTTGVIERVFTESQDIELDGETSHVTVGNEVPTYLVRHHSGRRLILAHEDVMLKRTNPHT